MRAVGGRRAAAFVLAAVVMILLSACQPVAGPISPVPVPELPAPPPPPPPACSTEGDGDGVGCDVLIIGDGQSHSNIPLGFAIPNVVSMELGYPLSNVGVGGSSWSTLLTTVHTRLGPVLADDASSTAVLLMIGGSQDIVEGDTAATVYADAVAYATAARSLATGAPLHRRRHHPASWTERAEQPPLHRSRGGGEGRSQRPHARGWVRRLRRCDRHRHRSLRRPDRPHLLPGGPDPSDAARLPTASRRTS